MSQPDSSVKGINMLHPNRLSIRIPMALLGVTAILAASGCSTFDRDYEVAVAHGPYTDFTGPWEGKWQSNVSDHSGRLRCLMAQVSEDEYDGRFQAKYSRIFTFEHKIRMKSRVEGGVATFDGRADLPFFGDYNWTGRIVGEEFTAEYRTDQDNGTFSLTRSGRPLPTISNMDASRSPDLTGHPRAWPQTTTRRSDRHP